MGGETDKPILVIRWTSYDKVEPSPRNIGGWGGFFAKGMRWEDYIDNFDDETAWKIPYFEVLRREIIEKKIRHCGQWHQSSLEGAPIFIDGTTGLFSYRAWGDLMAAIWSTEENRDYGYMDFYMDEPSMRR